MQIKPSFYSIIKKIWHKSNLSLLLLLQLCYYSYAQKFTYLFLCPKLS